MLKKIVRSSKFRHAYGVAQKRENCYEDIRVTKNSWDSNYCDVNPLFLAVVTESAGGGTFLVLPLTQTGRLPVDYPLVTGHRASILDLSWCPYDDHILASASEDCSVKVWEIPPAGPVHNILDPLIDINRAHERRACIVKWHPSASDILVTAGGDCKVHIWDLLKVEILLTIDKHPDQIMSVSWNYDGNVLLTTCKDKCIRTFDARSGNMLKSVTGHTGLKPSRGFFLKDGRILTTGFSKMSIRQYALWDLNTSEKPLVCNDIDSSNGIVFPFYDSDINMIYLAGKGDSSIRYFEYTQDAPYIHYIDTFSSPEPYRGVAFMPKRGLDSTHCEIARMYQLKNSNYCQIIGFFVPRKSEDFQEDLYPKTAACKAAISCDDWWKGVNANPIMMLMKPNSLDKSLNADSTVERQHSVLTRRTRSNKEKTLDQTNDKHETLDTTVQKGNQQNETRQILTQFMDELSKFSSTLKRLERRIDIIENVLNIKKL